MLKILFNTKDTVVLLFLVIKGFLLILFKICILNVIKNIDDNLLFFIDNSIMYKKKYDIEDVSDISDSESSNSDDIYENKIYDMIKFNCNTNKTLNKYRHNTIKYQFPQKDKYYIINAFLFNVTGNNYKIIDNFKFTKKLIILYYLENSFNTKTIKDLMPGYDYIYIFYKTDILNKNEYKIDIIDLNNNYELLSNKHILFNNINL